MLRLFDGTVAVVIRGHGSMDGSGVTVAEVIRDGDSMARSLCNGDAGDPGARHFADGHLE